MKILVFIVSLTSICSLQAQDEVINKIEFTSLSRGYTEKTVLTPDSLITFSQKRGSEEQIKKSKLTKKQWNALIQDLDNINLQKVPDLPSPTMKRAYDGAMHSTIAIHTQLNKYEHNFDDENPDELLMSLMKCIIKLKN